MPAFTVETNHTLEVIRGDVFGAGGTTTKYQVFTTKLTGGERLHEQIHTLSANVSNEQIILDPLGSQAPSCVIMFLNADNPVDVVVGAISNAPLSNVLLLTMTADVSALYVTTGSKATTLQTFIAGGSSATLKVSLPLP